MNLASLDTNQSGFTCQLTNMEFVFVKGGTFSMGTNSGMDSDFKPKHEVYVDSFYIGKYQVTQAEWQIIMGSNPSKHKGDRNPVEYVSWDDVIEFIKILNQKTGKHYRLPTEAEWEFASSSRGNESEWVFSPQDLNKGAVLDN